MKCLVLDTKGQNENQDKTQHINDPLADHRSQGLLDRHRLVTIQKGAAQHFAQTGNGQIGEISYQNAQESIIEAGLLAQGCQKQVPTQSPEHIAAKPEKSHQRNPPPSSSPQGVPNLLLLLHTQIPLEQPKNENPKPEEQDKLQDLAYFPGEIRTRFHLTILLSSGKTTTG